MKCLAAIITVLTVTLLATACGAENNVSSETIDSPYSSAAVGDVIQLGGLDWRVIDAQDNMVLVLSERILSHRRWHYEQRAITWGMSDMREYLNGPFFDDTFTEEEKAFIVPTTVINNINPWFGSAGYGLDTIDRVFLLSVEEVVQYFGDSGQLSYWAGRHMTSIPGPIMDEYNYARIATYIETDTASWWWLRTPGRFVNPREDASASVVSGAGDLIVYGIYLVTEGGVRPALWLRV